MASEARTIRVVSTHGMIYELEFASFDDHSVVVTSGSLVCHLISRLRIHSRYGPGGRNTPIDRWQIPLSKVVRIIVDNFPYRKLPAEEVLADYGVAKRLGIKDHPVDEFDDLAQCPRCRHTFPVRVSVY